jgi:hypothetical protein
MPIGRERLEESIGWICTIMHGCFAWTIWWDDLFPMYEKRGEDNMHYFWQVTFGGNIDAQNYWTMRTVAHEASLMNLRRLNEFFRPAPRQHADDLHAGQFPGFPARELLPKEIVTDIHKRIAHVTWDPVEADVQFRLTKLLHMAAARSIEFLDYLTDSFKPESEDAQEFIRSTRRFVHHYGSRAVELEKEHPWKPEQGKLDID